MLTICPRARAPGTVIVYTPCAVVPTEICRASITTLAPYSGCPASDSTLPVMVTFCACADAETLNSRASTAVVIQRNRVLMVIGLPQQKGEELNLLPYRCFALLPRSGGGTSGGGRNFRR